MRNRVPSSCRVKFWSSSWKPSLPAGSRWTSLNRLPRVSSAEMSCTEWSDRPASPAAPFCGNRNAPRTGARAGWGSSGRINGPRKRISL